MAREKKTKAAPKPKAKGKGKGKTKRGEKQEEPAAPPLPEGFEEWDTRTKLLSGGTLTEAQYNNAVNEYTQEICIRHNEAFLLRPLTISSGPLAGRRVLVLDPVAPPAEHFRFMDLPIELRKIVYEFAVVENSDVTITTAKPVYQERRAVIKGYESKKGHKEFTWDKATKKWLGQPPSGFTLLRVCKEIHAEALPTAYSEHDFKFFNFGDGAHFLKTIGKAARQCLRSLELINPYSYGRHSEMTEFFNISVDCLKLRALLIPHRVICTKSNEQADCPELLDKCVPLFRNLLAAQKKAKDRKAFDVLDVLQTTSSIKDDDCRACGGDGNWIWRPAERSARECTKTRCGAVKCDDREQHEAAFLGKLRKMVAVKLRIAS